VKNRPIFWIFTGALSLALIEGLLIWHYYQRASDVGNVVLVQKEISKKTLHARRALRLDGSKRNLPESAAGGSHEVQLIKTSAKVK